MCEQVWDAINMNRSRIVKRASFTISVAVIAYVLSFMCLVEKSSMLVVSDGESGSIPLDYFSESPAINWCLYHVYSPIHKLLP